MKLAKFLKQSGWTQREFAKRAKISEAAVSLWISGDRIPQLPQMNKIKGITKGRVRPADFY